MALFRELFERPSYSSETFDLRKETDKGLQLHDVLPRLVLYSPELNDFIMKACPYN